MRRLIMVNTGIGRKSVDEAVGVIWLSTSILGIADGNYGGLWQDPGTVRIMTGSRYVCTLRAYTNVGEHVEDGG
jgi:hypothetical protein